MAESDALWPLLREDAPAIARSLAAEIESNTCPICFELMKSPSCSPMLLYPCGHTFCAKCLHTHSEMNRKRTCPYCRQKIVSQALNLSLQKLINNFVALQKNPLPTDSVASAQYSEKLRQAETRSQILQCALANSIEARATVGKDITNVQKRAVQLESKQQETKTQLEKVNADYHRVLSEIRENQDNLAKLQKYHDEETAKVKLIQDTLQNLQEDGECEEQLAAACDELWHQGQAVCPLNMKGATS